LNAFWRIDGDDLVIFVKAKPGASRDAMIGTVTDAQGRCHLEVAINAPASDGKANDRLCRLIAKSLMSPPSSCTIESGRSGRLKRLRITGAAGHAEAACRLADDLQVRRFAQIA
jgi:uncharacterized protein (TIGR00251 family)